MLMEIKLDKTVSGFTPNIDDPKYCDDIKGEAFMTNPHHIKANSKNDQEQLEYNLKVEQNSDSPYYLKGFMINGFFDEDNTSAKHIVSPIMHLISSHYYF